jgi:hypothetical protein
VLIRGGTLIVAERSVLKLAGGRVVGNANGAIVSAAGATEREGVSLTGVEAGKGAVSTVGCSPVDVVVGAWMGIAIASTSASFATSAGESTSGSIGSSGLAVSG